MDNILNALDAFIRTPTGNIVAFVITIFSGVQLIFSVFLWIVNRKQKKELETLQKQYFAIPSVQEKIGQTQKDLEAITAQFIEAEVELPKQLEIKRIDDDILHQEKTLEATQIRLNILYERKQELSSPIAAQINSVYRKVGEFLLSQKTQQILMLFLGIFLFHYFVGELIPSFLDTVFTALLIVFGTLYSLRMFSIDGNHVVTRYVYYSLSSIMALLLLSSFNSQFTKFLGSMAVYILFFIATTGVSSKVKENKAKLPQTIMSVLTIIAFILTLLFISNNNDTFGNICFAAIYAFQICIIVYNLFRFTIDFRSNRRKPSSDGSKNEEGE